MAAGLFASLFAASSSSNSVSEPSAARSKPLHQPVSDFDAHSDETELPSPGNFDQDVTMPDAERSGATLPSAATIDATEFKEAQDVADVDMQLSSPPSSPPPTAPSTPQTSSLPLAEADSTRMEQTLSESGKPPPTRSSSTVSGLESTSAADRPGSSSTPTTQRASRRRTMPARLSQVSSLLAGSMLEEELLLLDAPASPSGSPFHRNPAGSSSKLDGAASSVAGGRQGPDASCSASSLTSASVIVLTSDTRLLARAVFPNAPTEANVNVKTEQDDAELSVSASTKSRDTVGFLKPPAPSSCPSLVSTLAIKRQQLIETPDFKQRDDTLYMPKTRGLRSDAAEDTSDAAYERRHRKPETSEKRQRKAEVERLSKDRLKLLSRIEQLKTVEARMLQPIVVARDQVRAEANGHQADSSSLPESQSKPLSGRIEDLRKELLDDAYETLKRYDLLLSNTNEAKVASPGPSTLASKTDSAVTAAAEDASRSQSPRLKIRIKGGRATWETAEGASPTAKPPPAANEKSDLTRRVSARQPKQRVESLPTPLTAAAVEAAEDGRRKRRRLSDTLDYEASSTQRGSSAAHTEDVPVRGTRKRGSPEVGGTYKGKPTSKEQDDDRVTSARRPQRAAAAAAAVASARQRQYAERSFSDFDYEDEDDDQEVESALEEADESTRRASQSLRQSPVKARDHRSHSTSSTTSSVSSLASSLGYMYPTLLDTGSLKVSQSLAEIQASDPEATSTDSALSALEASPAARKKLKLVLSRSPSVTAGLHQEAKAVLSEALDSSDAEQEVVKSDKGRALTESEAESILAAFLGTTPLGKAKAAAIPQRADNAKASPSSAVSAKPRAAAPCTSTAAPAAAAAPQQPTNNASTPSKRRSTRREATQSFGEKLPDLLTKQAQFDFSVMGYFRSIDKPSRDEDQD